MQRFDTIDKLVLIVKVEQGVQEYKRFMQDTKIVAKCEILVLTLSLIGHAFKPILMHFLRRCVGIRKLVVELRSEMDDYPCKFWSQCPCSWLENRKTTDIVLDALEEVEVKGREATDQVVRIFCKLCSTFQRRVGITVSECGSIMRRKILAIEPTNDKVEITVLQ
ncbi:hypothetical protein EJB05_11966, partial [Eragrostis curvula]